jgi:Tfp pilus assembly pilus retraction ATPase PilT
MLNPMSDEQRQVFQDIADSKNVIVDACAGSGKSTTILSIAKELPQKKANSPLRLSRKVALVSKMPYSMLQMLQLEA